MSTCYCTAPATTGALCTQHLGQLHNHLWSTPETLRELDVTITGQDAQGGGAGAGGTPMAFNETASTRKDDLLVVLRSAANAADPQLRHRFDETPVDMVARALGHLDALARSPHVHTIAQDLTDALAQAERVMQPAAERIAYGPCECGVELTAPKDADVAWCRGCGGRHELTSVQAWRHVQLMDRLETMTGTVQQIASWLQLEGYDVSPRTVEKWPDRRRSPLIACVQEGAPATYSYAQARMLAKKHSERRTRVLAV
ncbi:hypothetical protein E7Z53_08015 [Kocuria salina]|uniref:hypothetical protein n=1 Tax=Kocuria salina TaxID=1929416 RepID=UPI0015931F10|nr:hypothetical protein [Kocuria salina]NVC23387.1 hypothetical protein [Kocuria salina]